ncbi:MAG: 5-methyltetrahydrofolate--homocysteine methyltransferase [Bacteroidaceae bacterium]|nr:5-methyltetrahydrofolate--homocysteine methyltransferase [Bacteroidaceae bacterium]
MRRNYRISDLSPYINWVYFFHAWSLPRQSEEGQRLYEEAEKMLRQMRPYVVVKTVVEILPAWSDGDDIVVQKTYPCECGQRHPQGDPIRIPMLRQQTPGKDGTCLCLSDFIRPQSSIRQDRIGVFATSTSIDVEKTFPNDDYNRMLLQTLADRLAEAGAERLHEEVRKTIWGYAPDEQLTIEELHQERFQGIRPAVGYPCLPDISINRLIDELIGLKSIGVTLTEHAMMQPHASVSGFMLSLPQAHYFAVGKIGEEQLADYAQRRHMTPEELRPYIPNS